ncbi:class II histone deacetylase [Bacillus xiapuensis]|uniref:Class II histone deacetylase n=1 Tax=Bacillus xiapuensis TaxID=2014075 RepID=A0ABU6NBF6_9BACI|nr:class II histone deacetylase [Bacillus xiapuensis]
MKPTGFVFHEDYVKHDTGEQLYTLGEQKMLSVGLEFENHLRVCLIKEMLEKSGLLANMTPYAPHLASDHDLLRVHTQRHIDRMKETAQKGIRVFGPEVYGCPVSERIARLSAGGAMKAVDLAMDNRLKQAYALIRPPGHHAGVDQAMGFCLYNNVAVAARYAQEIYGLERIAIVDWDVHHGNGTEEIFYHDKSVLLISLHEAGYFPMNTGGAEEVGTGGGEGFNVNIPLPPATGDAGYQYAFENLVFPILEQYEPQLLLVSAGQDPNGLDPLSRMMVMRPGFRYMAKSMREVAEKVCGGRLAILQEGGYSLPYLPIATLGVIEGLMDCTIAFHDPHSIPERPITQELIEAVETVKNVHSLYWKLNYSSSLSL